MNRCVKCGKKLPNAETTNGIDFCNVCWGYEEQILEKDREIERLKIINKRLNLENQKLYEDLYCEPNNKRLAIEELENGNER